MKWMIDEEFNVTVVLPTAVAIPEGNVSSDTSAADTGNSIMTLPAENETLPAEGDTGVAGGTEGGEGLTGDGTGDAGVTDGTEGGEDLTGDGTGDTGVTDGTEGGEDLTGDGTEGGDVGIDPGIGGDMIDGDMGMMGDDMGMMGDGMDMMEGATGVKDPILSSWPFVIGISVLALAVGVGLGVLWAKLKIKKGIDLYED